MLNGPVPPRDKLAAMVLDAHDRTERFAAGLTLEDHKGPYRRELNPPVWEIGHVAWFHELWVLRAGRRNEPTRVDSADSLYDSSCIDHASRWTIELPTMQETLAYLRRVHEDIQERIARAPVDHDFAYYLHLAVFHEEMHNEAFAMSSQLAGRRMLDIALPRSIDPARSASFDGLGDIAHPGGTVMIGARLWDGFIFDNEKWSHPRSLEPFEIAKCKTTFGEFERFVDDGGYENPALWSDAGRAWLARSAARGPNYWGGSRGERSLRWFGTQIELPRTAPVVFVNLHEARAYANWAGRRIVREAEWEASAAATALAGEERRRRPWGDALASRENAALYHPGTTLEPADGFATGDSALGVRQLVGNAWEWTDDAFLAYPGFVVDPYRDYSAPWFGSHHVLRGASFATAPRMVRNTLRNFYTADRRDVFASFRTCARREGQAAQTGRSHA